MAPLSVLKKNWLLKNTDVSQDLRTKLLANRNLKTEQEIEQFFHPDLQQGLHDPFLMPDMQKAVQRVKKAIDQKERIVIFGDYDVDGITGTAILVHTLKKLGANFSYRLPHRVEDGYGLSEKFIREFADIDVKLLITVDNGISAKNEIDLAEKLGIETIITDHHTIPEKIPNAVAILHPKFPAKKYPFDGLTGAGVAFKFAKALISTLLPEEDHDESILPLLDLACMGTIADLGPMRGENRVIVKYGLKFLEQTRWPGLSRLKESAGIKGKMDTRSVGFFLGPRINAAGRMSHPYFALQLLLDDGEKSRELAENLEQLNRKRQNLMSDVLEEALQEAEKQVSSGHMILVVSGSHWHCGIVGLIASKLVETFHRPAMVMEDRGEILVGSARSVEGINVTFVLKEASEFLTEFGGHAQAAGFSLRKENLEKFTEKIQALAKISLKVKGKDQAPSLALECELLETDIDLTAANIISEFEPFGIENEVPRFLVRNVLPRNISFVGSTKKHLKFSAAAERGKIFDCMSFGNAHLAEHLQNDPIDLAVELMNDEWNGRKKLTLKVLDFRSSHEA